MQLLVLKLQPEGPGVSRVILGRERCWETPFCTLPLPRGAEGMRRQGLLKAEGVGPPRSPPAPLQADVPCPPRSFLTLPTLVPHRERRVPDSEDQRGLCSRALQDHSNQKVILTF